MQQKSKGIENSITMDGSGGEAIAAPATSTVATRPIAADTTTAINRIQPQSKELDKKMDNNQSND